jgi:hypothetical protein
MRASASAVITINSRRAVAHRPAGRMPSALLRSSALPCARQVRSWSILQRFRQPHGTAGALERASIALYLLLVFRGVEHRIENLRQRRVQRSLQAVVNPLSVPPRTDESRPSQVGQMTGDLRLRIAQNFHEVADAELTRAQKVQQTKPSRIAERLQKRDEIGRVLHRSKYTFAAAHTYPADHPRMTHTVAASPFCPRPETVERSSSRAVQR